MTRKSDEVRGGKNEEDVRLGTVGGVWRVRGGDGEGTDLVEVLGVALVAKIGSLGDCASSSLCSVSTKLAPAAGRNTERLQVGSF